MEIGEIMVWVVVVNGVRGEVVGVVGVEGFEEVGVGVSEEVFYLMVGEGGWGFEGEEEKGGVGVVGG